MLNESLIGDRASLLLSEFQSWLRQSEAGEGIIYASGELGTTTVDGDEKEALHLAALAWNCHEFGVCCLVQRAHGPPASAPERRLFDYIAYKKAEVVRTAIEDAIEVTAKNRGRRFNPEQRGRAKTNAK